MASSSLSIVSLSLALILFVAHADLQGDIKQSIGAVKNCINVVKSSNGKAGVISMCDEVLNDAIDRLKETVKAAKAGRVNDAQTYGSAAMTYVDTCKDEYGGAPRNVKSALAAANASISKVLAELNSSSNSPYPDY